MKLMPTSVDRSQIWTWPYWQILSEKVIRAAAIGALSSAGSGTITEVSHMNYWTTMGIGAGIGALFAVLVSLSSDVVLGDKTLPQSFIPANNKTAKVAAGQPQAKTPAPAVPSKRPVRRRRVPGKTLGDSGGRATPKKPSP